MALTNIIGVQHDGVGGQDDDVCGCRWLVGWVKYHSHRMGCSGKRNN